MERHPVLAVVSYVVAFIAMVIAVGSLVRILTP